MTRLWVRPRPWAVAAAMVAFFAAAACQTVIDGELGTIRCAGEGIFGPPACPIGLTCSTGVCVPLGAPVGHTCGSDSDCAAPAFCLDPAQVGGQGPARCTTPCCGSADCGTSTRGNVCWPPPDGIGTFCWPASELDGRLQPGEGTPADACESGADCRSGVCDASCIDTCCDDSYCADVDQACRVRLTPLAQHDVFACGLPPTTASSTECNGDNDCRTGKCLEASPELDLCAKPCCSSSECGTVLVLGKMVNVACVPALGGHARTCIKLLKPPATATLGQSCDDSDDCRTALCVDDGDGKYCSDLCCQSADCGDESAFECRVMPQGGSSVLRCARK